MPPFQRIPSRIHHNYDEVIKQSAYSFKQPAFSPFQFPKYPLPESGLKIACDWTLLEVSSLIAL
ncbi:hypothetical protein NPIL_438811, partial [Nephila pilipes]